MAIDPEIDSRWCRPPPRAGEAYRAIAALRSGALNRSNRHAIIADGHGTADGERAILIRNSCCLTWGDANHGWLIERFLTPRISAAALLLEEVDVSARSAAA